ncbi:MAG: glutamate--tRNA ligase [Thermodesulfobacteriota bacterium]|nr:glutamate--tRNA ligase [Thermodesulfobacteriota bacterium]
MEVRTRFAPSPTGHLHLGGARTALFNWLYSRHNDGKFVLRIEDTDSERSTQESLKTILESLKWLGLSWDEGPFFQSQRSAVYKAHLEKLINERKAYFCYCSHEIIEKKRKKALTEGKTPKYDGHCRDLDVFHPDKPAVVRFRTPREGFTRVDDLIKGEVIFNNSELDDMILRRSNGTFTYNFVAVVDDVDMRITHVIRGDDHLNNTPRQVLLYNAFGYTTPAFCHVPLILGQDKNRLSKRHGAVSISNYKEMGYLPQALVNYLVRLAWSYGDQEIFTLSELIEKFDLSHIGKSAGVFNPEKLLWLNSYYIENSSGSYLVEQIFPILKNKYPGPFQKEYIEKIINIFRQRCKTLVEICEKADFFFTTPSSYDIKAVEKFLTPGMEKILNNLIIKLSHWDGKDSSMLENIFKVIVENENIKLLKLAQAVRLALTGRTVSPGIYETIEVLGKEKVIERIKRIIEYIN